MINALSIDFEDWYQASFVNIPSKEWVNCRPAIIEATDLILDFLAIHAIKATFFVSGYIAQRHADLIKTIHRAGHEIESHGFWHQLAYKQTLEQFTEDISMSSTVIYEIVGEKPIGYRSPSWSTTHIPDQAAKILLENDFIYDSSLFPAKNFFYGNNNFKTDIHYYKDTNLLEVPPSTLSLAGLRIPVTGGFYLRFYPIPVMRKLIELVNTSKPVQLYFHPWEVLNSYPKRSMPLTQRFIQYYRCGSMLVILNELSKRCQFGSLRQAYPEINQAIINRHN